jgi:hypothetical protein
MEYFTKRYKQFFYWINPLQNPKLADEVLWAIKRSTNPQYLRKRLLRILKAVTKAAIKRRPFVIHGDTVTLVIWQLRESLEQQFQGIFQNDLVEVRQLECNS